LHVVLTRQTRAADPDFHLIAQHCVEMTVAGELPAADTDSAAADQTLGITDTTSPQHLNLPLLWPKSLLLFK
jgi:hypothetical protein